MCKSKNAKNRNETASNNDESITEREIPSNTTNKWAKWFKSSTGYDLVNFQSYERFTNWLHRPVDGSALGIFRMLYGAAMLIDLAEERGGSQMDVRFGEPKHCHFPLINGIQALDYPLMGCIYLIMWLGAIGIMLGYRFRYSCVCYVLCYWYIFLLDKPAWNNHSYLFGLVGWLLLFTRANCYCSLDNYLKPSTLSQVAYWNYFLIKYQFFLLYMIAGMKKFTVEWLSGYSMSNLSYHWLFSPFRALFSAELTDLLVVHWFTAIFDFTIAFLMTLQLTRWWVTPFMLSFHLMNSRLFVIGMFPWVCLAEVPLFFGFSWPRKINILSSHKRKFTAEASKCKAPRALESSIANTIANAFCPDLKSEKVSKNRIARLRTALILFYCGLQLFLPYSHFITKGYNNWTNGLYGYSWDMMVHSYDTVLTTIKIVDNNNKEVHYLNPYAFTEYDRWTKYADMAIQYAKCIEKNILDDYTENPRASPLSSRNFSIYFDIWCSMNGRFQQRVFDPRVDLLKAEWSPLEKTEWSLPLLHELNHMRPKLKTITNEVLAWNNYSDVIFVADFPGLTLESFISPDLHNISLTILEGNVRYKSNDDEESYFLTAGQTLTLSANITHYITTIGLKPSCFLYTYVNKTMWQQQEQQLPDESVKQKTEQAPPLLPLWQEFKERVKNYQQFLIHMGNCVLYLLYGVPIPMTVRERN